MLRSTMVNRFFLDTHTPSFVPNHVGQRKMHVCACPYDGPGRGRGGVAVCHVVYAIINYIVYIYIYIHGILGVWLEWVLGLFHKSRLIVETEKER